MLIRNIKSFQDLENAKRLQGEYLQLMIDNEKLQEDRVANYQNPNRPPPVPPQYKTSTEIQRDVLKQEKDAIDNLISLGLDYPTASSVAQNLQQRKDGVANLLKLNKNFPFIKKDVSERFNPKLLDSRVMLTYLDELFTELDETLGLKLSSNTTENYFQRDATGIKGVLPTRELVQDLEDKVNYSILPLQLDESSINTIRGQLNTLISNLPSEIEITGIDAFPTLEKNRIFKDIERLIKTYHIPTVKFLSERAEKIGNYGRAIQDGINLEAGNLGDGLEGEEQPVVEGGNFYDKLIVELSILKNTLGLMDARSLEKLQDLMGAIMKNKESIQLNVQRIEEVPVALKEGDVVIGKATPEAIQQYLNGKLNKQRLGKLSNRITQYGNYYPDAELPRFLPESPYYDGNPVFELQVRAGGKAYEQTRPFYIDRNDGVKKQLSDAQIQTLNLPNYLLVNKIRYYKAKPNAPIPAPDIRLGETMNDFDNFRYTLQETKQIIRDTEFEYLKTVPNYDPIHIPAQRKMPEMGFGITNKIVKHFDKDNKEMEKLSKAYKKHMKVEMKYGDEGSDSDSEKKVSKSGFIHTRIKVGKGIEVEEQPRFKTFGKYIIHIPHLMNDNILNVKYPSGGSIPSIKPVQVEENFKDFIMDLLETGRMSDKQYKTLTKPEQQHFVKIAKGANLINKLGIKSNDDDIEDSEVRRFELLKGEFDAGNNNEKLIKELRALLIKFMRVGKINKKQGMDFLMELSVV